jgi:hypothetical protein
MSQHLLNLLYYDGPQVFTSARVKRESDLFAMRGALFYTPTENIPESHVGSGKLQVWLPVAIPTIQEFVDHRSGQSVRLWVDLLQRATGKLRWSPMRPAKVSITRHDVHSYAIDELCAKSLLDALKRNTTGRRDGKSLHYFGAIEDDNKGDLVSYVIEQPHVSHPSMAGTQVVVEAA